MNALQQRRWSRVMSINKGLLTFSLLVPLVVASVTANARETISDKRYWPNEAMRTTPGGAMAPQRDLTSAFAYDQGATRLQPTAVPNAAEPSWRYHGGPKSQ
jgi:hypothetical protein